MFAGFNMLKKALQRKSKIVEFPVMRVAAQNQPAPASTFTGTLIDILDRVQYRRVRANELSDPVYRLRYEAYRREEYIPFNSLGTLVDEFDEQPNALSYGVYIDGALVSSLRIHYLTPECRMSPSYSVFTDVLNPLLDAGATCVDPTRFTSDFEATLAYPALPFLTLRLAVMATRHFGATFGLHSVRPEHGPFYKRVLSSYRISGPRYYHGLTFPMELWGTRAQEVYAKTLRRYPFFASTDEERNGLFAPPHATQIWVRPSVRLAQLDGEPNS
jgi:hypothetical protein